MDTKCRCKQCRKKWTWREKADDQISLARVHFFDLTDIGEKTACSRPVNDVTGCVTPYWPIVTCRNCLANKEIVDYQKVYPKVN